MRAYKDGLVQSYNDALLSWLLRRSAGIAIAHKGASYTLYLKSVSNNSRLRKLFRVTRQVDVMI